MREERGRSQIFFTYLPGQTADLGGHVWRVKEWVDARPLPVDQKAVNGALLSATKQWEGLDDGFNQSLRSGRTVEVFQVDENRGVLVEAFPQLFRCKKCGRVTERDTGTCKCGSTERAQLHFVAFHECGRIEEPAIPRCPQHRASSMRLPGTTRIAEIEFHCPDCGRHLGNGFRPQFCDCGVTDEDKERLSINVHRAGVVYTPRFATLVNSPDPSTNARLRANGGEVRALDWFIDGMNEQEPAETVQSEASLRDRLLSMGLSPEMAADMAAQAAAKGEVDTTEDGSQELVPQTRRQAAEQALSLASATSDGGRLRLEDLDAGNNGELAYRYKNTYSEVLRRAHLASVTLLEDFPVVNIAFGYTRGNPQPGQSRLRSFRHLGQPRCYGMLNRTEALLFELDPAFVLHWLRSRGHDVPLAEVDDDRKARRTLTGVAMTPGPFEDVEGCGGDLMTLVHSYSHRVVRTLTTYAGTDQNALGEYLLPNLGAFVVYGTGSGTFDLGGLRAVFEATLDEFLNDLVMTDPRCPLDPGCRQANAACMACLHLGERSCERFNNALSREVLTGDGGFLAG